MSRLVCLLVPSFPLAARLRSRPEPAGYPLALIEGSGPSARVACADAEALGRGVAPGLTLPQARALLPGLEVRPRDEAAERSAQQALLEAADAFSPIVEDAAPGLVYLDATGVREKPLAEGLLARAASLGLPALAGAAGTRVAARLAAEESAGCGGAPLIVPPGGEAAFLSTFAVERLDVPEPLADRLLTWGVRTLGEFAALPPGETLRRLGREGAALSAAARGLEEPPLLARRPPKEYAESFSTDWPISELEPFLAEARGALERLVARLESCDLAVRRLDLELKLEPEGTQARSIQLAAPTRDLKTLVGLVGLEFSQKPPRAPILGFTALARPDRPRTAQLMLFERPSVEPDKLGATIARLSAILGPDRVGRPALVDAHRPERFAIEPPLLEEGATLRRVACEGRVAVRSIRPAVELEAVLDEFGRPQSLRSLHNDGTRPSISGRVRVVSGPWALEEGWWLEDCVRREYWDAELSDGGVYRVYRDPAGRWWCDGIYD